MTRDEKINTLKAIIQECEEYQWQRRETLFEIIKDLEQETIFDKIRAEILEEKECVYADFEQYKVDYLGQDGEYALDSLPQDDFRYGMERALEIIDKYKILRL